MPHNGPVLTTEVVVASFADKLAFLLLLILVGPVHLFLYIHMCIYSDIVSC